MNQASIQSIPNGGLKVSTTAFSRIKAFHGGGDYWDNQPLIRQSLGEFLPPVEKILENDQCNGLFRKMQNGRELLWKSRPALETQVPESQVKALTLALELFKKKTEDKDITDTAREIISHFRLPDISKDPQLYRICGPWWNRRLQILWGLETTPDSSLAPAAAVAKLPVDKAYAFKKWAALAALLLSLLALFFLLWHGWPLAKEWWAKHFNTPPIASLKLDSLDQPRRIATVSDAGSHDPDGNLIRWHISWGDGQEQDFNTAPKGISHPYGSDGDYSIDLTCTDNLNATSSPPATVKANFAYQKTLAERDAARLAQEQAEKSKKDLDDAIKAAKNAEEKAKEQQQDAQRRAAAAKEAEDKAKEDQKAADAQKADAQKAQEEAQKAADQAKKDQEDAARKLAEPAKPPSQPPAPDDSKQPATPADKPEETKPSSSGKDGRKGGQLQTDPTFEIIKSSAGTMNKDGNVPVILVVRDRNFPNASIDVQQWQADTRSYSSGNAQFTTEFSPGDHNVKVLVRRSTKDPIWVRAKVSVKSVPLETVQPNVIVTPVKSQ